MEDLGRRKTKEVRRSKVYILWWVQPLGSRIYARENAQTFKVAGTEVSEVGTKKCSEGSGHDWVNQSRIALWLTENVLF